MEKQITLSIPIEAAAEAKKALYEAVDRLAFVEKMLTGASTLKLPQAPEPKPEPEPEKPAEAQVENVAEETKPECVNIMDALPLPETRILKITVPISLHATLYNTAKKANTRGTDVTRAIIQRELKERPADFVYPYARSYADATGINLVVPPDAYRELENRARLAALSVSSYCRNMLAYCMSKELPPLPQKPESDATDRICARLTKECKQRIIITYGQRHLTAFLRPLIKKELREKPRDYKYPKAKGKKTKTTLTVYADDAKETSYRARKAGMFTSLYTCDMIADILSRPENQRLFQQ